MLKIEKANVWRERERESGGNIQDVGIRITQRYISEEEGRVSGIRLQPPMQDPSMTHYKDQLLQGKPHSGWQMLSRIHQLVGVWTKVACTFLLASCRQKDALFYS